MKRIIPMDWKRFAMLAVMISLLFFVLWVMPGCAWRGVMGDGCVLCDSIPSPRGSVQSQALVVPPVIPVGPTVRLNGSAVVSLDWALRNLRGDIFQALQSACGVTSVEAKDTYGLPTAPAHDYGVEMRASTLWDAGINVVSVSVMVSRLQVSYQRREYVFVKNGTGSATYGESYGAYGARRVGMYRGADAATRFAVAAAIANLCGGTLSYRPRADRETPQEVPAPCAPPDCVEQTISVYGTWGGDGINSHWPPRPVYAPPARRRGFSKGFRGGRRGK